MITSKVHLRQKLDEILRTDLTINGDSICADGTFTNWVAGVIHSQYVGLMRAGVRIKAMKRTDLRVRWPIGKPRRFVNGQQVIATIPAEAVRLEAGMFRRSKQRWNRWIGRIVLVESSESGTVYTVKIHGEDWTLKAFGPVMGAWQPSKPWDVVNIVVDPQRVDLAVVQMRFWHQEGEDLMLGLIGI
jgi:hypothetical protein